MPGFLKRLFKPRWRHADPAVRREAATQLQPEHDREALETLLHDESREVRLVVLEKLATPSLYLRLLNDSTTTPALRDDILESLDGERQASLSLDECLDVVKGLTDPSALDRVATHADNQQLRLAALERLEGEKAMVHHACRNDIASVRLAAARRIESDEGLEKLVREARRDRRIVRYARDRLTERQQTRREQSAREQRLDDLLQAMTRLAEQVWEPMLPARYRHLVREWQPLAESASAEQRERFERLEKQVEGRIQAHDSAEREAYAREQAIMLARRDSQRIIASLEGALADLKSREHLDEQDIAQFHAHLRLQHARWRDLGDHIAPADEDRQHFETLTQQASDLVAADERLEAQRAALLKAIEARDHGAIDEQLEAIDWPEAFPPPTLMSQLPPSQNIEVDDTPGAPVVDGEAFEQDLNRLEAALERGELQDATRLLDSLMQRRTRLSEASRSASGSRLSRLNQRTRELRDWRSFAASPKRAQLIEEMETLVETDLDDEARDKRHRRLVRDWRALGDAAASRERATRFRDASDRVREKLADFYQLRDRLREENLARRTLLCDQLEQLIARPATSPDPDSLRTIRDRARQEWRHHAPVPRQQEGALRQRFSKALRALQTLIDQQARAIAESKQALVEEAQALENADMDDEQRAEQAKALQARWRALGRAPRGEEQTLWRAFRKHCDVIFKRRDNQRASRQQHRDERLEAMQALIERMDQWQPRQSHDQSVLEEAEREAEALSPLPQGPRTAGMMKRWQGIVRDRSRRLEQLALEALTVRWSRWQPLLALHADADGQALAGSGAKAVASDQPLDARGAEAHALRNERRSHGEAEKAREWFEHLRVHLAVLTGAPLSQADSSRRLDVQVARLNSAMGSTPTLLEEIEALQCRLLASGPIEPSTWQALAPVFNDLMARLSDIEPEE